MTASPARSTAADTDRPLLRVEGISKEFVRRGSRARRSTTLLRAVDNVSFDIVRGEAFGIVGESGCGKSTLARVILRLIEPTAGTVYFDGTALTGLPGEQMRALRRRIQVVFQDPYSSLDPRMTVHKIVEEPLVIHKIGDSRSRAQRVHETLDLVGIMQSQVQRKPHEFSGGQRQRIAIARALILGPELIVLDEPVSALDVSIQAQVLNLLKDLQDRLHLTYIFIVHDLAVAEHFCDRLAVLYLGAVMELGRTRELFTSPQHPYSRALVSAAPVPDPTIERQRPRIVLRGEVALAGEGHGCRFEPRCPVGRGRGICKEKEPQLLRTEHGQLVACHFPGEAPVGSEVHRGYPSAQTAPESPGGEA